MERGDQGMSDEKFSAAAREILGPKWCGYHDRPGVCEKCLNYASQQQRCSNPIEPSPDVAYALGWHVSSVVVSAWWEPDTGAWRASSDDGRDRARHAIKPHVAATGGSRVEAECNAHLELAARRKEMMP